MRCTKCLNEMTSDDTFCVRCGTVRTPSRECRNCGTTLRPEAIFCPKCGQADTALRQKPAVNLSHGPELEAFYFLFPNMRSPKAIGRSDYWMGFIVASFAEGIAGVLCGMLVFELSHSSSLSNLVFWIFGLYIFFRLFGHKYGGRLIDAGLENNLKIKHKSIALAAVASLGGFLAWWLALIGWVGLLFIFVYIGVAPTAPKSTKGSDATEKLKSGNPQEEYAFNINNIDAYTSLQECISVLLALGCRVRSIGENKWEVVDLNGETYHAKSIEALRFLAKENSHAHSRPSAA